MTPIPLTHSQLRALRILLAARGDAHATHIARTLDDAPGDDVQGRTLTADQVADIAATCHDLPNPTLLLDLVAGIVGHPKARTAALAASRSASLAVAAALRALHNDDWTRP